MRRRPSVSTLVVATGVVLVVFAAVALRWGVRQRTILPQQARQVATAPSPVRGVVPPGAESAGIPTAADDLSDDAWSRDEFPPSDESARAWASVDFAAIREALPDNTYWKMAAPTKDPEILREREEVRTRWNAEYGKVLSNTASDEEIDAFYAERQRVSEDYLHFIVYLLTNYGYQIPPRDVAALKLAAEMHNARLEEIPRKITEAHQRHAEHDAARRAWLEQQQAFERGDADAAAR